MEEGNELTILAQVSEAIATLDEEARRRVITWLAQKYGAGAGHAAQPLAVPKGGSWTSHSEELANSSPWNDFADFFSEVCPESDVEKALAAGFWRHKVLGEQTFSGGAINGALKDLGHQLSNVTVSLNRAIKQKPSLAIQVKKSGSSKQGRKTYKLTAAGMSYVEKMISKIGEAENELVD